jgi:CHAT domain-containing protein
MANSAILPTFPLYLSSSRCGKLRLTRISRQRGARLGELFSGRTLTLQAMGTRVLVGFLIAALAGLALAYSIPSCGLGRSPLDRAREELVASLGPCRPMEGRLSMGLRYARYEHEVGFEQIDRRQRRAILGFQRLTMSNPSLAASDSALMKILAGHFAAALLDYEAALERHPLNSQFLSDAAAISMVEFVGSAPTHYLKALHLARQAVALNPDYLPARFNLALALEKNQLKRKAIAAWGNYLARDPDSNWAREAHERCERLKRPSMREEWLLEMGNIDRLALNRDIADLVPIVLKFPEFVKDYTEGILLGEWANFWLQGDSKHAQQRLEIAQTLGEILRDRVGEYMASGLVEAILHASESPRTIETISALARGQQLFLTGRAQCLQGETENGYRLLGQARSLYADAGSPGRLWADLFLATCAYKNSNYHESLKCLYNLLAGLSEKHSLEIYPALVAKVYWIQGLCYISSGEPSRAAALYEKALDIYAGLRFVESMGAINYLLSESLRFLGESVQSSQALYRGLELTTSVGDPWRMYAAFDEMANAAPLEGYKEEALFFRDEVVRIARSTPDPPSLTHAFLKRAEAQFALGSARAALKDLEMARRACRQVDDPAAHRRAEADILLASGKDLLDSNPASAISLLDQAFDLYKHDAYTLSDLDVYQAKSRAFLKLDKPLMAEAVLRSGIEEIERIRSQVNDDQLRVSYLDDVRSLFDQMIFLQAQRRGGEITSLAFAEESRSRVLFDQIRRSNQALGTATLKACKPDSLVHSIPSGAVFLEYAMLEDRILLWTIRRGQPIKLRQILVSLEEFRVQVLRLEREIHQDSELSRASSAAAWLYDILIRPAKADFKSTDLLIVSKDKALQRVPFALLWDKAERRFLVEDYGISDVPSCAIIQASMQIDRGWKQKARKILIIGNPALSRDTYPSFPNLPSSEVEAHRLAELYGRDAVLWTGAKATAKGFIEEAGNFDVVHVAAHAEGNAVFPDLAHFILAPSPSREDGAVYAYEMQSIRPTHTRLVVIATCGAVGNGSEGGEVQLILARAILAAGIPSVIGSLWQIDDRTGSVVFLELHRRIREGQPLPQALRGAQLQMLYSHAASLRSAKAWGGLELFGGLS